MCLVIPGPFEKSVEGNAVRESSEARDLLWVVSDLQNDEYGGAGSKVNI